MNPLTETRARLRETVLNIAVRIDDHDDLRMCARMWSHAGPRPTWVMLGAVPMAPFVHGRVLPLILLVALVLAVFAGSRLADCAHETGWTDRVHPCPLCPHWEGDDDGPGRGGWGGDDFPTAPPPMGDYDDEQYREWTEDMAIRLYALLEEVSS